MHPLSKQNGAAIIVALFVTSLVAIASVAMIMRLRIELHDTELVIHATQGYHYAQGSIAWAMEQLNNDWNQKKPNKLVDSTPIKSPINQVNDTVIRSTIFDTQGRFNINNLSNSDYEDNFILLIMIVDPAIKKETARTITLSIIDWITPGIKNTAIDDYYLKAIPSYRAPHRLMVSVSELRLVKGITPTLYAALAPYLIALPEVTRININNTTAPVLMCLSKTLTLPSAKAILAQSKQSPFTSIQQFSGTDIIKNNPIPEDKITVLSNFFLVKTSVDHQDTFLYTLLQRIEKNAKPYEVVLWQSKGTL
jgi:general secretion pathway protein K